MAGSNRKKLKKAAAVIEYLVAEVVEWVERGTETQKRGVKKKRGDEKNEDRQDSGVETYR